MLFIDKRLYHPLRFVWEIQLHLDHHLIYRLAISKEARLLIFYAYQHQYHRVISQHYREKIHLQAEGLTPLNKAQ